MRFDSIHKTVNGKTYTSHLLREASRDHGRVRHRTIANLSSCSDQETRAIRLALKHKGDLGTGFMRLSDLDLPESLRAICREVPAEEFCKDVSPTEIRRSGGW